MIIDSPFLVDCPIAIHGKIVEKFRGCCYVWSQGEASFTELPTFERFKKKTFDPNHIHCFGNMPSCYLHCTQTAPGDFLSHLVIYVQTGSSKKGALLSTSINQPNCPTTSKYLSEFGGGIHINKLLVLSREWMGCWGLLGWFLIVSQWIIPSFSTFSTSKTKSDHQIRWKLLGKHPIWNISAISLW